MATLPVVDSPRGRMPGADPHPGRAIARLSTRLIRRVTISIAMGVAAIVALEALAFRAGYPDEASRAALITWGQDPGIRIIAGPATAVETVGGFVVWDAGLYLTLILAAWAITMTTRVLRSDECTGRTELMLAGPIRAGRALILQLAVLLAACLGIGATLAGALALAGGGAWGAVLFGAAMAGYSGVLVGLTGLASQVFSTRLGTLSATGSTVAAFILLRMLANSADSRAWVSWLTPSGWTDQLQAFGAGRWPVLAVPFVVAIGLVVSATVLRMNRDTGAGLLAARSTPRSHRWGLGGSLAFAWRSNLGVLLGWAAGVVAAGFVVGALLPTVDQYLATDDSFQEILATMGMNVTELTRGFIGMWATIVGLIIGVYAAFRMGSVRAEEASTRAELLLTRPISRWRWLGGHVLCLLASVVVLCAVTASAMWIAGAAAGAELTAMDAYTGVFNALPMVLVFAGLGVLVFGVAPRMTVAVTAGAAVGAYVLELVGPLLDWPAWLVGLSPFHHLESVPVDPFGWPAAIIMITAAALMALIGLAAFERRDLVGA